MRLLILSILLSAFVFHNAMAKAGGSRSDKPDLDKTPVYLPVKLGETGRIDRKSLPSSVSSYVINEGFQGSFPPSGWTVINPDGARTWSRTTLAGGYGSSSSSARVNFYDYSPNSGQMDSLKTPILVGLTASDSLVFDYAYCEIPSVVVGPDTVEVYLSTDGGAAFATHMITLSEPDSTTGPNADSWAPESNEWKTIRLALPPLVTGASVQIAFIGHNHFGQNFYIDNVLVGTQPADDIQALSLDSPANGDDVIEFTTFTPLATFRNVGTANQVSPFSVRYEILNTSSIAIYTSTKSISSLISGTTQQVTFDALPAGLPAGTYTIRATSLLALDVNPANDTLTGSIEALLRVTSLPYVQNFDGATEEGWIGAKVSGSKNDWIRGTPNKPVQLQSAHSGANAWVTRLDTTYSDNHNAALYSPYFDFTSINNKFVIEFYHNFRMESGWDAGVLESSTNLGSSWVRMDNTLGVGSEYHTFKSRRWYNNSSTDGNITPNKWSDNSTAYATNNSGWIRSTTSLNGLIGKPNVRFRWRFRTDGSNVDEGWAIDDMSVFEDSMRTVQLPVNAGWNMISNPVDSDVDSIFFSGQFNYVFGFNCATGYYQSDSFPQGPGFWGKVSGSFSFEIDGRFVNQDTIPVCAGWNLIGSISLPAHTSAIVSEPPGIITSPFYEFSGGYTTSTLIEPGKAYWVKVTTPGSIILTGSWTEPPQPTHDNSTKPKQ